MVSCLPPGVAQNVEVVVPYRHTFGSIRVRSFDNRGNVSTSTDLPVIVPPLNGDPYEVSVGGAVALTTGGQRLNIDGDDRYVDFLLPIRI